LIPSKARCAPSGAVFAVPTIEERVIECAREKDNRTHLFRSIARNRREKCNQAAIDFERSGGSIMPRGDKSSYTNKQKRRAEHIEDSYEKRGTSKKEAERRAWATVNKESGGGERSGSGRGHGENRSASRKGGRNGAAAQSHATRVRAGKKAARTRARRSSHGR
jgi:plasmid stabilization system protein ParE